MRSLWKGSISFGLVTIPVRLYAATEDRDVRFHLLHEPCRTPIQYRKWCPTCDRPVEGEEIVKGFEREKGRYVVVTDEELESIPVAAVHTLEIVAFVRMEQIDPVYFDRTYYLEPGEGGARAYALLRRAMEETGRIAIARVVIRTRESLAVIRTFQNGVLALETMHFPEEIRSPAGLAGISKPEIQPRELEMAVQLISSLSEEFDPGKFENRYRTQLLALIEAKAAGEEVSRAAEAPAHTGVVDLMTALRASIQRTQKTGSVATAEEGVPHPGAAGPGVPGLPPAVPASSRGDFPHPFPLPSEDSRSPEAPGVPSDR